MKKKISIILVLFGFVFLCLVVFLPGFLSSEVVLLAFLERVNTRSPVTWSVENCDIGWGQGFSCSDVEYADPERGLHIQAQEVSGEQGLLALLAAPQNIGTVHVQHPVITLSPQDPSESFSSPAIVPIEFPDPHVFPGKKRVFWDFFTGTLMVEEGRLVLAVSEKETKTLVGLHSGSFALDAGTVQYDMQWRADTGLMSAKGYVNLPGRRQHLLDALVVRMKLLVADMPIAPLLSFAGRYWDVPQGAGLVSGEMTITASGGDSIDVVGELHGRDIALSGGVLEEDHPRLKKVSIFMDGSVSAGKYWRVGKLDIEGDHGTVAFSGEYGDDPSHLRLTGTIHLPVLFAQFPHLFRVQADTLVEAGRLKFFSELSKKQSRQELVVDLVVDPLQGIQDQQPFSWENGIILALSMVRSDQDFFLKRCNLSSAFLTADGVGHWDDFSFQLGADLEKAGEELGKVFVLPWSGKGDLAFEATSAVADGGRYSIGFQLTTPKLSLALHDRDVFAEHPLRMQGQLDFPEIGQLDHSGVAMQMAGSFWPGTFALTLGNMQCSDHVLTARYSLSAGMNLDRLGAVLNAFQVEAEPAVKGDLRLAATGFFTEDKLLVRELDARITDYMYTLGRESVREKELFFRTRRPAVAGDVPVAVFPLQVADTLQSWQARGSGLSGYDWFEKQLFVRNMNLRSSVVNLEVNELVVDDPWEPSGVWRAELAGEKNSHTLSAAGMVVKKELKKVFPGLFAGEKM